MPILNSGSRKAEQRVGIKSKSMKIIFTFILSLFSTTLINAQIVLNSNEMMGYGSSFTQKTVQDFTAIDTTTQGANVTWNFANLQPDNSIPDFSATIVNPASTPYGFNFPSSNYAYQESPTVAYRYFSKTSSKMERVGSWSNNNLKTYNDPQIEYVFPLQLGITNNDTWDNTGSTTGGTYDLTCMEPELFYYQGELHIAL